MMIVYVPVWFAADTLVKDVAFLALCLVVCLCWLNFQEKRERRKAQHERRRERLANWGHE